MKVVRWTLIVAMGLSVAGCATKNDYSAFYAHPPRSILVVPVLNETVEMSAPGILVSTVASTFGERGYYVFPTYLTDVLLRDLGLSEAGLIHQMPPGKFLQHFGADAVLFITVTDWSGQYVVLSNIKTIRAKYCLVDTRTGQTLWSHADQVQENSNGGNGGILGALVAAAVDKMVSEMSESQFRPLASQLNVLVATRPGMGLPVGPYHPKHGQDRNEFPAEK